jgi:hypothetical protein
MKEALEQVRQALGGELPEPHTPAFEQALRRIQRERPDLLDVLKSLQDPQALPPTNATHQANLRDFTGAARRARSVERTQNWLNRWFGIKDPRRDKVHFNYRLMALVIGGVVFLGGVVWAVWPDLSRALSNRASSNASTSYTSPTSSSGVSEGASSGSSSLNPVPAPPPVADSTEPTGALPPTPTPTPAPPAAPGTTASTPANVSSPTSPPGGSQVVPPPPLPEYSATPAPSSAAAAQAPARPAFNPVKLEGAQRQASENGPVALKAEATPEAAKYAQLERESAKEVAYTAVLNPASAKYTTLEGKAEARNPLVLQAVGSTSTSYTPPIQPTSAPAVSGGGYVIMNPPQEAEKPAPAPPSSTASTQSLPPTPAPAPAPAISSPQGDLSGSSSPSSPTTGDLLSPAPQGIPSPKSVLSSPAPQAVSPYSTLVEYPFEVGEKQEGELVSGVVIPEGSSQAALMVRTKEGYIFFGAASLDKAGRLQMQFDRAYKGKTAYVVRAIALDQRGVAGIPAQVSEQTPNLLANLLRGAASGLVSYIDLYAKSSSTTILPGGGIASSNTPPPLGLTILSGSAKQIAAPPDSTSVVRVWSLDPGTKMQILIVPGEAVGAESR